MRKLFLLIILCYCGSIKAQNVGIGTTSPHSSAVLDITSINKGVLVPRMFTTQRLGIVSPARGLLVFDNNTNSFWFYNGTVWTELESAGGVEHWQQVQDSILYTSKTYVGVNTDYSFFPPQANLEVKGSLLVQGSLNYTSANPTVDQTFSMNNTPVTQIIPVADSVFRIYDPGGMGNYLNNTQGNISSIGGANCVGFKLSSFAPDFGLGTGDTLWISKFGFPTCRTDYEYRFTNTTVNPADMIMNYTRIHFVFRSNGDGNNNKGFNFMVKKLFSNQPVKNFEVAGPFLSFNASSAAFTAGSGSTATGRSSTALGDFSKATAVFSFAAGNESVASGTGSFAAGLNSTASGYGSVAMGGNSTASGFHAVAVGDGAQAAGDRSIAMGLLTSAMGDQSVAMGYRTISNGYAGMAVGLFNDPIVSSPQFNITSTTPLFIVGNGESGAPGNAMVVKKNGNIGIGTDYPLTRLHILGGADANLTPNSGYLVIGDYASGNIVIDNNEIIARDAAANSTLYLQTTGGALEVGGTAAKPGGGSWAATSDVRLKQNIKPYNEGLQQLMNINPVSFQYNSLSGYNTNKRFVGVIAQDLQKIAPYMVGTFTKNGEQYYNVDNGAMTYMLINAVKEQQKEIEELKATIKKLEKILLHQ